MARRPSNLFQQREVAPRVRKNHPHVGFLDFLAFVRVEEAKDVRRSVGGIPSQDHYSTKPMIKGELLDQLSMSPLDLFNPLRVLHPDQEMGHARRNTDVTEPMLDLSEVNMSSRSMEELEWELSDDDDDDDDDDGFDADCEYEEDTKEGGWCRELGGSSDAYKDLSNRSLLQRKRSEASSGDNCHVRDKASAERSPSRVSFNGFVRVVEIPHHDEYSDSLRDRIWSSARDIRKLLKSNLIEFMADGSDWRTAKEEDEFAELPTGELVHPATWLQVAPLHSPREFSASSPQKRSARKTGRSGVFRGFDTTAKDTPLRRVDRRLSP